MTAITRSAASESKHSGGRRHLGSSLVLVAAVGLAFVVVYTGWLAFSRIEFLLGWDETFSGAGSFTVVACEPEQVFGPDRWRCDGRLTTASATDVDSVLVVGKDARMSSRPYVGEQIEVFYDPTSTVGATAPPVVYARDAQLSELSRLYLALPPLFMILIGAAGALLGLGVARLRARTSNTRARWRTSPLLLDLQRRGTIWLIVGVVTFGLYQLLVRYVLGSAGVA